MEAEHDTEETGDRVGRYRVLGRLGAGGMATVDLAEAVGPGGFHKLVALKRILPDMTREPHVVSMFFDEARIAARIQHPNVVAIHELGEDDGTPYMALEYVHGESLSLLMDRFTGPFPLAHIAHLGAQLCDGLHAAHDLEEVDGSPLGLVHRDVSPQNVLIGFDGFVKLTDFGIAKARGSLAITPTGGVKGKYAYLAPEQALGHVLDRRADIFSLGIVLWEISVGQRLFPAADLFETLRRVREQRIPPPSELVPGFPVSLEHIIMKALARDREERWSTCHEMQMALEQLSRARGWTGGRLELARFIQSVVPERAGLTPTERSAHIALAATVLVEDVQTTHVRADARRSVPPLALAAGTKVLADPGAVARAMVPPEPPPSAEEPQSSVRFVIVVALAAVLAVALGIGYALAAW